MKTVIYNSALMLFNFTLCGAVIKNGDYAAAGFMFGAAIYCALATHNEMAVLRREAQK